MARDGGTWGNRRLQLDLNDIEPFLLAAETAAGRNQWVKALLVVIKNISGHARVKDDGQAMKGWMTKIKRGRSKRRYFILLGRVLYYYRKETDTVRAPRHPPPLRPCAAR